jgi:hypothetical protein
MKVKKSLPAPMVQAIQDYISWGNVKDAKGAFEREKLLASMKGMGMSFGAMELVKCSSNAKNAIASLMAFPRNNVIVPD